MLPKPQRHLQKIQEKQKLPYLHQVQWELGESLPWGYRRELPVSSLPFSVFNSLFLSLYGPSRKGAVALHIIRGP